MIRRLTRMAYDLLALFDGELASQSVSNLAVLDNAYFSSASADMNCDGAVNFDDVGPFVQALIDPVAYALSFPACDITRADTNGDTQADGLDVESFLDLILAP